ncbi:hypothetical protein PPBDW_I21076 [Photobacterium kishitanii]|nr:hypothetical protein PPBDW_I21076 [Photobacterium kishitanii]
MKAMASLLSICSQWIDGVFINKRDKHAFKIKKTIISDCAYCN